MKNRKRNTKVKQEIKTHFKLLLCGVCILAVLGAGEYIANQPELTKIELFLTPSPLLEK